MKQGLPLTESIETNSATAERRSESTTSSLGRSSPPDAVPETNHTVTVRVVSTVGYADNETFVLGGEKEANAFARGVMKTSLLAFKRVQDGG